MTTSSQHDELADRLLGAIEAGDLDGVTACYAPELALWMNITRETNDREGAVEVLRGFVAMTSSRRYEVTARTDTPSGYVQEHVLHVVGNNGVEAASAACLIVEVDDTSDRITSIHEYLDSRALTEIFR